MGVINGQEKNISNSRLWWRVWDMSQDGYQHLFYNTKIDRETYYFSISYGFYKILWIFI